MYIRHLGVADFRSWSRADVALGPGPTVFIGANGQGKTNLVEAAGYLPTFASHRVPTDGPLIRLGAERAVVQAAVVAAGRELRLEVEILPGRANKVRLGGAPVRPRDVLGVLRCVVFAPEDLSIVRGDPSERRHFLDELSVQRAPRIAAVRTDYDRTLRQRGALLKSAGVARRAGRPPSLDTLDVWDGQLAGYGAQLLSARLLTLSQLAPLAAAAYAEVAPTSDPLLLAYQSSLHPQLTPDVPVGELESLLLAALAAARPAEVERGVNLVGPHRDDLVLSIGALPVRGYASHGEGWSAALALRLGSFELLRDGGGGDPVLILDDVFAELDGQRRDQLARAAGKAEQVLITAAVASDVPIDLLAARYDVAGGELHRA